MQRRAKSGLLWGAIGALAFLALAQGYVLIGGRLPLSFLARLALAAALGVLVAGATYAVEHCVARKGRT